MTQRHTKTFCALLAIAMLFALLPMGQTAKAADGYSARIYDLNLGTARPGYYAVSKSPEIWNTGNKELTSSYAKLELTGGDTDAFRIHNYGGNVYPGGTNALGFSIAASDNLPAGNYRAELTLSYDADGGGWNYDFEVLWSCQVSFSVSSSAPLYSVTVNGGTATKGSTPITSASLGDRFWLKANDPPSGQEFSMWEKEGDTRYSINATQSGQYVVMSDSDLSLTALYKPTNTWAAYFDANGGSGTQAPIYVTKGEKLTLPQCTFTPPAGYIFSKWYNYGAPGASGAINSNITIRAEWKPIPTETITNAIHVSFTEPKPSTYSPVLPDFSVSQDNNRCEIITDAYNTTGLIYMVNGTQTMGTYDYFDASNFYRAMVFLEAKTTSDRQYTFPDGIKVYFNGKEAIVEKFSDTTIRAYFDYDLNDDPSKIKSVAASGVTSPSVGEVPNVEGIKIETQNVQMINAFWVYDKAGSWEDNGTAPFEADKNYAILIMVKPADGYSFSDAVSVTVNGFSATEIAKVGPKNLAIVCAMPFAGSANPFTDVPESEYYYEPVLWAVNHTPQITKGTSDTTFSPNATCTRGQVVTFLWRAMGEPEPTSSVNKFSDVQTSDYFYKAVLWAVEKGITLGTSDTTFSPNDPCTRAHVVTFLWRAEGQPSASGANPFADVASGQYYYSAVLWAVSKNITQGTSATTFSPDNPCTRAQIVTFLYRDMK